jgi:cephalosporin hydroxylase
MDKKQFDNLFKIYKPIQNSWELYWLVNKVEKINPKIILEIGVNTGSTLGFWNYILSENKNTGILIGIDIRNNMKWNTKNSMNDIKFLIADSSKSKTIDIVENILQNKKVDFLYIDGNHSEKFVTSDYQNYSKFVRKGGIIAFHDINNKTYPGVKQSWDKVKGRKEFCILQHGTGMITK